MDLERISVNMQGSGGEGLPSAHNHDPINSSFDSTGLGVTVLAVVAVEFLSALNAPPRGVISTELALLVIRSNSGTVSPEPADQASRKHCVINK